MLYLLNNKNSLNITIKLFFKIGEKVLKIKDFHIRTIFICW